MDTQRAKVYRGELAAGILKEPIVGDGSIDAVQAFIHRAKRTRAWERFDGPPLVEVHDGRGRRRGAANRIHGYIKVPKMARRPMYLCHELAHLLSAHYHNPPWVRAYLALVYELLGDDRMVHLRKHLHAAGVRT
jgi:hypothetical protein